MKLNIDICIPSLRGVPEFLLDQLKKETSGAIHISTVTPLTYARMELIKKVKTPLFLFLDDDILYPEDHLLMLYSYFNDNNKIGAVQGFVSSCGLGDKWDDALNNSPLKKTIKNANRLFASNIMIRTCSVKDWNPPRNISGCEDWDLTDHIRNKGYDCLTVPSKIQHKVSWFKMIKNAVWFGNSYPNMFKKFPLSYFLKLFLGIGKSIITFPINSRLSFYTICQNFFIISGMLKCMLKI